MGIATAIDITPDNLETVESILRDHLPNIEVRAFGSRVSWTARDHSNLDLIAVGPERFDNRKLADVKEAFEESALPIRVDVLDWPASQNRSSKELTTSTSLCNTT